MNIKGKSIVLNYRTAKRLTGNVVCRVDWAGGIILQVEEELIRVKKNQILKKYYRDATQYDLAWLNVTKLRCRRIEEELDFDLNPFLTGKINLVPAILCNKILVHVEVDQSLQKNPFFRRARRTDITNSLLKPKVG